MRLCTVVLVGAAAIAGGCAPVYAPPVRGPLPGAPAALARGQAAVSAAFGPLGPQVAEPEVSLAVTDHLAVSAGGNITTYGTDRWAMGFGGVKGVPWVRERHHFRGAVDLELGAGLGVGGACENEEQCDDRPWYKRMASGGYAGAGVVIGHPRFAPFVRARVQGTQADGIPPTLWWMAAGGLEAGVMGVRRQDLPDMHLYVNAGAYGLHNRELAYRAFLLSWGVRVAFDTPLRRR